jgi:DNA-binding MarR family transcriptional regulator
MKPANHELPGDPGGDQPSDREVVRQDEADPIALRALAHPLRWKLIDLLGSEGSATATRCAEALGESVASCSYHLGILGKYGYIELVPDQPGREKPWRLTSYRQDLSARGSGIETELASEAATEAFLEHEFARTKNQFRHRSLEPAEWREASMLGGATLWVTAEELREISGLLSQIVARHEERLENPGLRPEGAREARVFVSASVMVPPGSRHAH